jgi:hypothetical protein
MMVMVAIVELKKERWFKAKCKMQNESKGRDRAGKRS